MLLYNMGRAYEGLGDLGAAAQAYEDFLRADPKAPDRGALERRIATLRRQLAEREALRARAERDKHPPSSPSAVPWIVAGVGAAGVAAGVVFGVMSSQKHDDAVKEPTYREAQRLDDQSRSYATVANVSLIAGGVVLALGVVWGILDLSASGRSASSTRSSLLVGRFELP